MEYKNTAKGRFISRPNRFIAEVEIDGQKQICHVKNTGRCKELLLSGSTVLLEKSDNPNRKTLYDLVAVYKDKRLINMDSMAPNAAAGEFLPVLFPDLTCVKPEFKHQNSRFDFYFEHGGKKAFLEVKGVTLEDDGVVRFPDAPTERGIKHLNELAESVKQGFEAYVLFVIQMEGVKYFTPNYATHQAFGEALAQAEKAGVKLLAYDCKVTEKSMTLNKPVKIICGLPQNKRGITNDKL